MQNQNSQCDRLSAAFDRAEYIATVGSPSTTTDLKVDINATAVNNKLVGEIIALKYRQQNAPHYVLGLITEIELRNRMLEDHTIQTIARHRGHVDHVSDHQDTHDGKVSITAVYRDTTSGIQQSVMGTVPATGTRIKIADDSLIEVLTEEQADRLVFLGTSYQSNLALPMWFRQFNGAPGQLAEAHHLGIFGQSGSGKSTLAKLVLLAYASHPELGILIIDPQGEFSKSLEGETEDFNLPFREKILGFRREIININVSTLTLARWDIFEEMFKGSRILTDLRINNAGSGRQRDEAAYVVRQALEGNVRLQNLYKRNTFDDMWDAVRRALQDDRIYAPGSSAAKQRIVMMEGYDEDRLNRIYEQIWRPMMELFNPKRPGGQNTTTIIRNLLMTNAQRGAAKQIVNINLDIGATQGEDSIWTDEVRNIVINQILSDLGRAAEEAYRDNTSLNTLVVIDEAQRLAPNVRQDDEYAERIRRRLADAARTTRKYGLGWMFISQSLSGVNPDIARQTRIRFFGYGMAIGSELDRLREMVGGSRDDLSLYQSFPDPESAITRESRSYSFMVTGPVSPLCATGRPLFLSVYNSPDLFISKNPRLFLRQGFDW